MAHRYDKDEKAWIIDGFENGIASSPHAGIADMKNLNINSFPGEAAVNYARILSLPAVLNGTMNSTGGANTLSYTPSGSNAALVLGSCVIVNSSTITNFASGSGGGPSSNYFWVANIPLAGNYQFAKSYNGPIINNFGTSGTASFSTVGFQKFIQGFYEFVQSANSYRYYLLDQTAQVWVNDPNVYGNFSPSGLQAVTGTNNCQGFGITQGVVFVFIENICVWKFTNRIGDDQGAVITTWDGIGKYLNTPAGSTASHKALRSQVANGSLLYPDSQFIGLFQGANSQFTLAKAASNGGSTLNISVLEQGVNPVNGLAVSVYAVQGSTVPSGVTEGVQYYIVGVSATGTTFQLATSIGGSGISISTGSFYVTSFFPTLSGTTTITTQAVALPYYEQATALSEISIGSVVNLVVGGITENLYLWDESSSGYTTTKLPEGAAGTKAIVNFNNVAVVFDSKKGNIYLTNGTGSAGTLAVPDYCANPNGSNQDPVFTFQDAVAMRGRVFFSISDQTTTHTGNCGGIWSFTPPNNGSLEVNLEGQGLHFENQNSYGTYNGSCDVILPSRTQNLNGPQYWTAWSSSITSPSNGIDFSGTIPYTGGQSYIDTDLIPLGTFLDKGTPINFEYKLSRPLVNGESVQILARPNLSSQFALVGVGQLGSFGITTTIGAISDVFASNVQNIQWIQCRIVVTSVATNPSFVPITQLMIRV